MLLAKLSGMNGQHLIMVLFHITEIFSSKLLKKHPAKYFQYHISPIFILLFSKITNTLTFFITTINK